MDTAALSSTQWRQVCDWFNRLSSRPAEQRDLDHPDIPPALIDPLKAMLAAHDSTDPQLLDKTLHSLASRILVPAVADQESVDYCGQRFGPWRAIEELGRGGMAVVLRGERADGQFEKQVAIKLLPSTNAGYERERLLEEIRILARLEHPNIAHLIDGGISETGVPYLVMEYVDGRPITEYCHVHRLDVKARIKLLLQAIEAVDYAHAHLVVHCDIKPANILVSEEGRIKLVDFGIAGIVSAQADRAHAPRGLLCSPGYAAPEQLRGAAPAIAQDIFSLGAVMYLLLCGQPIRNNQSATRLFFTGQSVDERLPPPSCLAPERRIPADLDAICFKAMATEPTARYSGCAAFSADLRAWLKFEPVDARMGGFRYRSARWFRRHWLPASALCAVLIALIGGTGVALWQAQHAREQASAALLESARAQATRNFLVQLFEANDPHLARGQSPTARELLEQGKRQIDTAFAETPALRAEMVVLLGRLYHALGHYDTAMPLIEEGLNLVMTEQQPVLQADALIVHGALLADMGDMNEALEPLNQAEQALELAGRVPGPRHAALMHQKVNVLAQVGMIEQAIAQTQDTSALAQDQDDLDVQARHDYLIAHALALLLAQRDIARAIALIEQAIQLSEAGTPTAMDYYRHLMLGAGLRMTGRLDDALAAEKRALKLVRQSLPAVHYRHAQVLNNLSATLIGLARHADAADYLDQALAIYMRIYGDRIHPRMLATHNNLGLVRRALGDAEQAEPHLRIALEHLEEQVGTQDLRYAQVAANLGGILVMLERFEKAEDLLSQTLEIRTELHGPDHPDVAEALDLLSWYHLQKEQFEQALELSGQTLDILERNDPDLTLEVRLVNRRARILMGMGRLDEAREMLERGMLIGAESSGDGWPALLATRARLMRDLNDPQADEALGFALSESLERLGQEHYITRQILAEAEHLELSLPIPADH